MLKYITTENISCLCWYFHLKWLKLLLLCHTRVLVVETHTHTRHITTTKKSENKYTAVNLAFFYCNKWATCDVVVKKKVK